MKYTLRIMFVVTSLSSLFGKDVNVNNMDINLPKMDDEDDDTVPVFQPTNEWQTIQPGQSIPPGLHVRVDLQTGLKEAKLMDSTNNEENSKDNISNDGTLQVANSNEHTSDDSTTKYGHSDRRGIINKTTKVFTRKELSEMLKNVKDDGPSDVVPLLSEGSSSSNQPPSSHTNDLITLDELKQMVTFHSDVKTMLELLTILTDPTTSTDAIVQSLNELEYYVHQIDNARDLDILGGLAVVVKLLNHSDNDIKSTAAFTLGAAVQGNPEVQKRAFYYQALTSLLTLLEPSSSEVVQRRSLYALGSLLRGYPAAVEEFITRRGIELVSNNLYERSETVTIKIVTLLSDLLETENLDETSVTISTISSALSTNNWCVHVSTFIGQYEEMKKLEKIIHLMYKLRDTCDYVGVLTRLEELYSNFSEDDINDVIEPLQDIIYRIKRSLEL